MQHLRRRVQKTFTKPSLTQQQFKDECNINNIMKKYAKTGELPIKYSEFPTADISNVPSYHEALNSIIEAESAFMSLGSHVRKKFNNNALEFLEFLQDPKNIEESVKLGLRNPMPKIQKEAIDPVLPKNDD